MRFRFLFIAALFSGLSPTLSSGHTEEGSAVQSEVLVKATRTWDGALLPAYPQGQPEVTILRITIPPKTSLPWHTHPVINAGVLLSGELRIHTKENEVLELKAGDALIELVDKLHYGENPGEEPAVIVVFYAGIEGVPVTVPKDVSDS